MKNAILFAATLLCTFSLFAQKAEVKQGKILSDGKAIAKIEKDGCGALSPTCNFYISDLNNNPLITVTALEITDPPKATKVTQKAKYASSVLPLQAMTALRKFKTPLCWPPSPKM